jgi:hypothetical protein
VTRHRTVQVQEIEPLVDVIFGERVFWDGAVSTSSKRLFPRTTFGGVLLEHYAMKADSGPRNAPVAHPRQALLSLPHFDQRDRYRNDLHCLEKESAREEQVEVPTKPVETAQDTTQTSKAL